MNRSYEVEKLISDVDNFMTGGEYGYTDLTKYRYTWRKLLFYAKENGITEYNVQLGCDYLEKCCHYDLTEDIREKNGYVKRVYRHVQVLTDFYLHGIVYRHRRKQYIWPEKLTQVFEGYLDYRRSLGRSKGSVQGSRIFLNRFVQYLEKERVIAFQNVNESILDGFVKSLSGLAIRSIVNIVDDLRQLLEFAYENGFHVQNLKKACPRIRAYRNLKIPSIFTTDEINKILSVIDREGPIGMRDYAILLVAIRLGIRQGDILNLRFSNIDWDSRTIKIIQGKTKQHLILPLLEDVGWALIDYLKNGRPTCDCDHIFVRHNRPIAPLDTTYDIVQKYIRRSNIQLPPGKRHGLHALRHSLASKMLEQGSTLPEISGVLGHLSSDTTKYYLKVDIKQLRQCALEVE